LSWGSQNWEEDTRLDRKLDDPLRHWRKDKFKAALAPQRVNYSNLNKNSSPENLMLSMFLDEYPSTSIPPTFFVHPLRK
jgi:hypothetical protein